MHKKGSGPRKKNLIMRFMDRFFKNRKIIIFTGIIYLVLSAIMTYFVIKLLAGEPPLANFVQQYPHLKDITVQVVDLIPVIMALFAGYLGGSLNWINFSFLMNKEYSYFQKIRRLLLLKTLWINMYTINLLIVFVFYTTMKITFGPLYFSQMAIIPVFAIPFVLIGGSFFAYQYLKHNRDLLRAKWFLPLAYPLVSLLFLAGSYAYPFFIFRRMSSAFSWMVILPIITLSLVWLDYKRSEFNQ
jgi:hypothetical protein